MSLLSLSGPRLLNRDRNTSCAHGLLGIRKFGVCLAQHLAQGRGSVRTHISGSKPKMKNSSLYKDCCCLVTKSCPTLCNPMDCDPPGSSVHGISHLRILGWVATFFSRGSSRLRDQTHTPALAGEFFTHCAPREALTLHFETLFCNC